MKSRAITRFRGRLKEASKQAIGSHHRKLRSTDPWKKTTRIKVLCPKKWRSNFANVNSMVCFNLKSE